MFRVLNRRLNCMQGTNKSLWFVNVMLLHNDHRRVSATHVAMFRMARTGIQTQTVQIQYICHIIYIYIYIIYICWSQWPRGLKGRSAAARLLRSWVRIPPGAWMFVCCECCVLSGGSLCDELITRPEESYRLWCVVVCDLETSRMRRPWPVLGRSATNIYIYW